MLYSSVEWRWYCSIRELYLITPPERTGSNRPCMMLLLRVNGMHSQLDFN